VALFVTRVAISRRERVIMRKTIKRNLVLNRDTIRALSPPTLGAVAGAKNITVKDTLAECPSDGCTVNCTHATLCA
jgi:hypothetical protein